MLFKAYDTAKANYPDIDTWLADSVYKEYPLHAEEILAESVCNTSELPWEDPEVFERIVLVINGRDPIPEIRQELTVLEICRAVAKLKVYYPEELFNDSVANYIAAHCTDEGYAIVPKIIGFCQALLPITNLTKEQQEVLEAKLRFINDGVYDQ